jgi:hypothetical protein
VNFTDLLASASSGGAGPSTTTNTQELGDAQTVIATLVAALTNPGVTSHAHPVDGPMQVDLKTPGEQKDFKDALAPLAAKKANDEAERLRSIVATAVQAGLSAPPKSTDAKAAKKVHHGEKTHSKMRCQ